jgi:hypothetical protein
MSKIDIDAIDPAIEPDSEKMHRATRIALGFVPGVGGALVEVFNSAIESPLTKRRWETMVQIGEVINDLLERKVVTEEDLHENEAFISTVAEVCAISLRNHQKEKLEALRNAVRNSALPSCPADDYRQLFLNFVDVCTVTHIKLLQLFDRPQAWFDQRGQKLPNWTMGSLSTVIDLAMPDMKGHNEIRDSIWKDLFQRGLVTTDGLNTGMSGDGMLARRTSPLGVQLIAFLS